MSEPFRPSRPLGSNARPALAPVGVPATPSSSLPRRSSVSLHQQPGTSGIPMSTSRPSTLRRPSSGNLSAAVPSSIQRPGSSLGQAPSSGIKRSSSAAGLPPNDSELSSLKRQLARALSSADESKLALERVKVDQLGKEREWERERRETDVKVEKLERERERLLVRDKDRERERAEELVKPQRSDAELSRLRNELELLAADKENLEDKYRSLKHKATQALEGAKSYKLQGEELLVELDQEQELRRQADEDRLQAAEEARKLREELDELRAKEEEGENVKVVKEELHRQVSHLRTLEKDNSRLLREVATYKSQHANIEILREAKKSLEAKVRGVEELRLRLASAEGEADVLRREKDEWLALLGPSGAAGEASSPRKLTKSLAGTRLENASLLERLGTREAEIAKRDRIIGALEARARELQEEGERERKAKEAAEEREKAGERRRALMEKEVGLLKANLESYATEEAMNAPSSGAAFDTQKSSRIVELEDLLSAHKKELSDASKQVQHWRGLVERYGGSTTEIVGIEERQRQMEEDEDDEDDSEKEGERTRAFVRRTLEEELRKNEELEKEVDELKNENELMIRELESMDMQLARLENLRGMGAYDPTTTKVLALKANPDSESHAVRTSTLERLQEENQALLARLEGRNVDSVPRASLVSALQQIEDLEKIVAQKEVYEKRSVQAFADKADEFRKVVFALLGYRLDFLANGLVRVRSQFAPSKEHSLMFSSSSNNEGSMELLGPGGDGALPDQVRRDIQFWVHGRKCVPGFLASLTLTLFEDSTRGRGADFHQAEPVEF